ncbi:hypothetical protein [Inquilinus sp. Marseille-Q2685]|uniref:hypothetical protein n=1 Tax=Inquilinus sp. Marseille-Q2685 TaxID=2866581 RepID=UPI001CE47714|nr:hypothetical protein [Inquilinus sp. Marseille-Q2685]
MDEAQSDSDEIRPTDPDMHWTGWALDTLRELVAIDVRTKRMTETQQLQTPAGPDAPDFDLKQSRLSRSVRLSIAMTERIRADHLMRREERKESGEEQRRRQRRDQAVEDAVRAAAKPDEDDIEYVRSAVRERLVEDEILDAQLDSLTAEEFVREVCRKIGRPPNPAWLPRGWADAAGTVDTISLPDRRMDLAAAGPAGLAGPAGFASPAAGDGWSELPDESGDGCPLPRLPKPDSS